jgi:hypothetical protein
MTDRLTHLAATARHLPTTDRNTVHEAEVRAMQRGLRQLAARGVNGRPTGFRPKYSPSAVRVSGAASPRVMLKKSRLDSI